MPDGINNELFKYTSLSFLYICLDFINLSQPHYGPGVDSASNRNEYQEYSWG
jgi:hypothetical protein